MNDSQQAVHEMVRRVMTESLPEGIWLLLRSLWPIILVIIILLFIKARMRRSERAAKQRARRADRDAEYRRMAKIFREVDEEESSRDS